MKNCDQPRLQRDQDRDREKEKGKERETHIVWTKPNSSTRTSYVSLQEKKHRKEQDIDRNDYMYVRVWNDYVYIRVWSD